jgi:hypothetical protein
MQEGLAILALQEAQLPILPARPEKPVIRIEPGQGPWCRHHESQRIESESTAMMVRA